MSVDDAKSAEKAVVSEEDAFKVLDEHDEREAAELDAIKRKFDMKALALTTEQTYAVKDKVLGVVSYRLLTTDDVKAIGLDKIGDADEKSRAIVFAMLKKADDTLSRVDFDRLPYDIKNRLVSVLIRKLPSFLPYSELTSSKSARKLTKQVR